MRQVLLASVRVYARRYVAAMVAIVIGVGFVVATGGLTSAARNGILDMLRQQYAGADLVVSNLPGPDGAGRLLRAARALPGVAAAENESTDLPVSRHGAVLLDVASIGTVSDVHRLRWQTLTAGRFPAGPGQALVDADTAAAEHIRVGDLLRLGRGSDRVSVRVSGVTRPTGGAHPARVFVLPAAMSGFGDQVFVDNVVVSVADGSVAAVASRLQAEAGAARVQDVDAFLQEQLAQADRHVDVIKVMLLVFASVALFVAALVIANTFTVMLAARVRDFALLRCVGATRRQVLASVRAESMAIGAVSATAGVLVGLGTAHLLVAVGARTFTGFPLGAVTLSPRWMGAAWLVGVLVTLAASLLPARRATRVSPLAALLPDPPPVVRSRAGAARLGLAAPAALAGVGLLLVAERQHALMPMLAGGAVSFLGVLLAGPLLVPACVRLLGTVTGRFGVPGRLAVANALRNPRRTAATAGSLLVGVTLISGLLVGMATVRSTVSREIDAQYPVDAALTARAAVPAGTLTRVRRLDGVRTAVTVPGAPARVGRNRLLLLGVPGRASGVVHGHPGFLRGSGTVYVPWSVLDANGLTPGGSVPVQVGAGSIRLRVAGTEMTGEAALVPASVLAAVAPQAAPHAVWVRAGSGADAARLQASLQAIGQAAHAELTGSLADRARMDTQLWVMTIVVLSLLGVGVVIALVGVGATLGLSVLERGREHALLRAMGLTRRQLVVTLAFEAALQAVVAGLLGVLVGTGYAWVGAHTVLGDAVGDVTLTVPFGRLAAVVAAAAAAGLLACVLPARRAARVTPAAGLCAD